MPKRPVAPPLWAVAVVDHFPAQALAAWRPTLRTTAYAVVEQRDGGFRAACLALSPAARHLGAEAGAPLFVLRRRHGAALGILRRDPAVEEAVRDRVRRVCLDHTPDVRVRGGRGRLEVHLALTGTPLARRCEHAGVGAQLWAVLSQQTGLEEVAVGVSSSRLVARVMAAQVRPRGVATCPPGAEQERLAGLSVESLPGLTRACRDAIRRYGIEEVDQLLRCDRATLMRRFGRRAGEGLYGLVRGLEAEFDADPDRCLEVETVLTVDLNDDRLLREAVRLTADKVCHALRQAGQVTAALRLRLTYTDGRRLQRSAALSNSTDAFVVVNATVQGLFDQIHRRRVAVRAVAVAATRVGLTTGQGDLFEGTSARRQHDLGVALTDIRSRLGFAAVLPGGAVELAGAVAGRRRGRRPRP